MTGRQVPFFPYPQVFLENEARFIEIFRDVGGRGAFILQRDLEAFEAQIAECTGAAHAVGVANATDGLQLALLAGGLASGDEVIICSHTMIATASAVHFAGGVPVPVETGPDHLIDVESVGAYRIVQPRAVRARLVFVRERPVGCSALPGCSLPSGSASPGSGGPSGTRLNRRPRSLGSARPPPIAVQVLVKQRQRSPSAAEQR